MLTTSRPSSRVDLDVARREFERWRRTRPRGTRIPEALWRMALDVAREHGVSKASQTMRLDYYAVKRRLGAAAEHDRATTTEFVELSLPAAAARCQIETGDDHGDRLRVEVSGLSATDLAMFVRAVAGRDTCCK